MANLIFPDPISDEAYLIGREAELETFEVNLLQNIRRPFLIVGERRIGKTSLQTVSVSRLSRKTKDKIIPIVIPTVTGISSASDLAIEVLQAFCRHFQINLYDLGIIAPNQSFPIPPYGVFIQTLSNIIKGLEDKTFVLCIDEWDTILVKLKSDSDETDRIFGLIDSLVDARHHLPIVLSLTMTLLPEKLQESYGSRAILQTCEYIQVLPLELPDSQKLIYSVFDTAYHADQAAINRLHELSGGNPYILKLLLKYLLDERRKNPSTDQILPEDIENILPKAVADPQANGVLANIYDVHFKPEEQKKLLCLMALQAKPIELEELHYLGNNYSRAARELAQRGYLSINQHSLTWRMEYFYHWLIEWVRFESEIYKYDIGKLADILESDLHIIAATHQVMLKNETIDLTPSEYQTLIVLAQKSGQIVTRDEIIDQLYPKTAGDVNNASIDSLISRLRNKLKDDTHHPRYIITRSGEGYILNHCLIIQN